jgi:hypothetical protein
MYNIALQRYKESEQASFSIKTLKFDCISCYIKYAFNHDRKRNVERTEQQKKKIKLKKIITFNLL